MYPFAESDSRRQGEKLGSVAEGLVAQVHGWSLSLVVRVEEMKTDLTVMG